MLPNLKYKKEIWCFLLLEALFLFYAKAQVQYFTKLYDFDSTADFGRNVILRPDGSYFVFEGGNRRGSNQQEVRCYNVSADGSTVANKKAYAVPRYHLYMGEYGRMSVTNSGHYVVPLILDTGGNYNFQAAGMMKVKPDGDTAFTAFYTNTSYQLECSYDISCAQNGQRYYIAGLTYDTTLSLDNEFGLLLITDTNGRAITRKSFAKKAGIPHQVLNLDPGVCSELFSVECLPDGNILLGAGNGNFDALVNPPSYGKTILHMRPWFILADSNGNIIKDKNFGDEYAGGGDIKSDSKGGYFHWGALFSLIIPSDANAYQNFPVTIYLFTQHKEIFVYQCRIR